MIAVRSIVLVAITLAVGASAGWLLRGNGTILPQASSVGSLEARTDLSDAAIRVLDDPDRMRRMERLNALLSGLSVERFSDLAYVIEHRAVIPRQEDIGLIMHAWARLDPVSAFQQALEWKRTSVPWTKPIPDHTATEVMYVWAQDPTAMPERVIGDAPVELHPSLAVALIRGWAESGQIDRATAFAENGVDETMSQLLVLVLVERIVESQGVNAGIEWAESLSPGELRSQAFRRGAGVIARMDPSRAMKWTVDSFGRTEMSGMARMVATERARREDPREVLAWVNSLSEHSERRDAATWVVEGWFKRSPTEALDWLLASDPLDVMYRPILLTRVRAALARTPQQAVSFTSRIADPERRREIEIHLAQRWLAKDEAAARAWMDGKGITADVELAIEQTKLAQTRRAARRKTQAMESRDRR